MVLSFKFIGFTQDGKPIYNVFGGAPEGEGEGEGEDTGDGDEGANSEDDDSAKDEEDYKAPSKAEWALMQRKLNRANGEAASRRKFLEKHGIDPKTGDPYDSEDEDETATKTVSKAAKKSGDEDDTTQQVTNRELEELNKLRRRESKTAAAKEARLTSALAKHAAQNALREAGWNGNGASLVERMLDLSEVEIDDDGNVVGLDEQVLDIKSEMPDWFKVKRVARKVSNGSGAREVDGADKNGSRTKKDEPVSWLHQLSAQIDGE